MATGGNTCGVSARHSCSRETVSLTLPAAFCRFNVSATGLASSAPASFFACLANDLIEIIMGYQRTYSVVHQGQRVVAAALLQGG